MGRRGRARCAEVDGAAQIWARLRPKSAKRVPIAIQVRPTLDAG